MKTLYPFSPNSLSILLVYRYFMAAKTLPCKASLVNPCY